MDRKVPVKPVMDQTSTETQAAPETKDAEVPAADGDVCFTDSFPLEETKPNLGKLQEVKVEQISSKSTFGKDDVNITPKTEQQKIKVSRAPKVDQDFTSVESLSFSKTLKNRKVLRGRSIRDKEKTEGSREKE